jgi:hypothetical protein
MQRGIAHVEEIGAERQVRSVFLKNAEGEQAGALRAVNAFAKVGSGEFLPVDGEFGRWSRGLRAGVWNCDERQREGNE